MKLADKRDEYEQTVVTLQRGEKVRKYLMALRYKGGQTTISIAISVAKARVNHSSEENLKLLKFGKEWAQSLFRRMSFKRRAASAGKVRISKGTRKKVHWSPCMI